MNFFISNEQEEVLNTWIDEQNKIAMQNQLNDKNLPQIVKDVIIDRQLKEIDIPHYPENFGYYSISFTPTSFGNRIYAHHHINGESFKLQDFDDIKDSLDSLTEDKQPLDDVVHPD